MIYGPVNNMLDALRGKVADVDSLNARIDQVNAEHSSLAPHVQTFWSFDVPELLTASELPAVYLLVAEFVAAPAFQGQRDVELGLEIGCVVDDLRGSEVVVNASLIAEALGLVLDDLRGIGGLGEYLPDGYSFSLSAWAAPGEGEVDWGGFLMRARLVSFQQLL